MTQPLFAAQRVRLAGSLPPVARRREASSADQTLNPGMGTMDYPVQLRIADSGLPVESALPPVQIRNQ